MSDEALLRVAALGMAACGIALLQAAWRIKANNGWRLIGGWSLIGASIVAWAYTSGADKGAALGIIAAVIIALLFVGRQALLAERRGERQRRERVAKAPPERSPLARRIWVGALLGPIAGLAALSASTALYVALIDLSVEQTAALTTVFFAFPLLWAALAVVAGYVRHLGRKSATILAAGLLPLMYIFLNAN
ncbi:MAG: hypothetical protein AAGC71_03975 [Pseudomonadota bacterium]